jgi:pseudaminic acid biosynthesis-associated methylase
MADDGSEARRLEELWEGDFGDDYVERNTAFDHRQPFWDDLLGRFPIRHALEVGCNVGGNLRWIASHVERAIGIDVNRKALGRLRAESTGSAGLVAAGRRLPFADGAFDLTFTMGVLIHQPEESLRDVMSELVRTSGRYVLCAEYFAERTEEVPYRDQTGALFRRDYGGLYQRWWPELQLLDRGFLGRDAGWDDVTWWLFEQAR